VSPKKSSGGEVQRLGEVAKVVVLTRWSFHQIRVLEGGLGTLRSAGDARQATARLVTEVMSPVVLIVFVTFIVSVHSAGGVRGLALGLVAIFFAGALPYGFVLIGVRRGRLTDHHISVREQRPQMMAIALGCVVVALLVLVWLDAPRALFALMAAMVAGLAIALAITWFWKISIHAAAAAGTVASLAILVSPWWLLLTPLVVLTGWARVAIRKHTTTQVLVGAIVGATVTAGVLWLVA
jgi:membrane-associated phospholipid phosphatase